MPSIQELSEAYARGIEDGIKDVSRAVLDEATIIISEEAIDTHSLLDSGEVKDTENPFEKRVAWTVEHAPWVNFPTGPAAGKSRYMPPLEAIEEWVKRNARIGTDPETVGEAVFKAVSREGTRNPRQAEITRIAQVIRWKIYNEGTEGVHFAERSVDKVRPRAGRLLQDAVDNRLSNLR